ncbi:hypothetical protein CRM22_000549 [Opisthorchis felineus]|uniref:purine-nucleoside phosphorylase n=1 Tax=Opisthorchis felineus TaxID=147828 RepID=A0A4S2MLE5_OPIFE|nr:hypothetical protein CRM22_000549 [Opisthorchis felineus]
MEAASFQNIQKIADHIQKLVKLKPSVGIIAGSGLGVLATVVEPKRTIAYKDIPGFPQTTVAGHDGNLVFGTTAEKTVVIMQGRFHQYEGFSAEQIVLPIRVLKLLGVETLLISNAAGGLSENLKLGDFVILTDHISLAGLTTDNVLVGPNDERFGPRFPDTADAYCPQLRRIMQTVAGDLGLADRVHTGVYFHTMGPSYGTKAENRMLLRLGGNVVDQDENSDRRPDRLAFAVHLDQHIASI